MQPTSEAVPQGCAPWAQVIESLAALHEKLDPSCKEIAHELVMSNDWWAD